MTAPRWVPTTSSAPIASKHVRSAWERPAVPSAVPFCSPARAPAAASGRVSSEQLPEVRHRLGRRVRNLRNLVIHQTLTERFVDAFRSVVHENLPLVVAEVSSERAQQPDTGAGDEGGRDQAGGTQSRG